MKRALLSESIAGTEAIEELPPAISQPAKRKKLKHRVWRWVGAGGDVVY